MKIIRQITLSTGLVTLYFWSIVELATLRPQFLSHCNVTRLPFINNKLPAARTPDSSGNPVCVTGAQSSFHADGLCLGQINDWDANKEALGLQLTYVTDHHRRVIKDVGGLDPIAERVKPTDTLMSESWRHPEPLMICRSSLLRGNLRCLSFASSSPFYRCLSSLLPSCCSVVWADVCPGCWMKTSTSSPSLSSLVMCMLLQLTSSLPTPLHCHRVRAFHHRHRLITS